MAERKKGNSLFWGIVLIIFGVLFLLDQFEIDIWRAVWRFWPVILIVWGADKLVRGLKERNARLDAPAPDKGHEI
jgi:EamA domain-containing membrane protein RarD